MKTIYKSDDARISVADAKRLIYNALPDGNAAEVYMYVDADGNPVWDGPIEIKEVPEADLIALNEVVLDMCQQGLITPRFRYRPTRTDYTGHSDDAYLLDHADFVVMAQMLDCKVCIGADKTELEEIEPGNPALPTSSIDFSVLASRDKLVEAFGSHTGMNMAWFDKLEGPLLRARKYTGQGGYGHTTEPWFCPYEVLKWLTGSNFRKRNAKKMTPRMGWRMLKQHWPAVYEVHHMESPIED